ncbi:DUF1772 domain-containing protein [Nocardioides sp.]|uniref:anthrone oxygenase family protein n=1 Tax=Nocardioides sp. TaxID=35761 RepID=UPI003528210D
MKPNADVLIETRHAPTTEGRLLTPATVTAVGGVVFAGAIFGFFYAWVCSTMWGLDQADPRVAIEAMQAMNGSVRNAVFAPAFFLTPVVLGIAAALCQREGRRLSAGLLALAAVVYLGGGLILTMTLNVPMNEDLARVVVPAEMDAARQIWQDYSASWQVYNQIRTVLSGVALTLAATALVTLSRQAPRAGRRR